jgi:AcrR family transcriptional regulator
MGTKNFVFFEAFKLFSKKPYDQVTYSDLEQATGLSRGAIL